MEVTIKIRYVDVFSNVDVYASDYLVEHGRPVKISVLESGLYWQVTCEWREYLSAVWHALAVISRGSVGCEVLRLSRCVVVEFGEKSYSVEYGYRDGGIYYGSFAV